MHSINPEPLMSALGQKRTLGHLRLMSALPPKADIGTQSRNLVGAGEQRLRARLQMGSVPDNDELSYVLISAAEIDFGLHPLMALPETAGV